eukprot:767175-Hanusia_phi.AAC.3
MPYQLKQLMAYAEAYGFRDWLIFDASVVRGLAYYTGVVFEGFDRKGELRAICGGGRYDELLGTFGGEPLPAVGFGFGDAVIAELLKDRNLLPNFDNNQVNVIVFPLTPSVYASAAAVAGSVRSKSITSDLVLVLRFLIVAGRSFCRAGGQEDEVGLQARRETGSFASDHHRRGRDRQGDGAGQEPRKGRAAGGGDEQGVGLHRPPACEQLDPACYKSTLHV